MDCISRNLKDLCLSTTVDDSLLLELGDMLTEHAKDTIMAEATSLKKATTFYKYMTKRPDRDLQLLINALRNSGNDKAADILEVDTVGSGTTQTPQTQHSTDALPFTTEPSSSNEGLIFINPNPCTPESQAQQPMKVYNNGGPRAGLIINVLKNRPGAEFDEQKLLSTFSQYNFQVDKCVDLTTEGINQTVVDFKKGLVNLKLEAGKIDAVFIAVMSHGAGSGNDMFYSHDHGRLSLHHIIDGFNNTNCPSLVGVPKIFLVNVCRGDQEDSGTSTDSGLSFALDFRLETETDKHRPSWTDMLICYPSYDHHVAYRESTGTWFIQTFCDTVQKYDACDIRDILDKVMEAVSEKTSLQGTKQIPLIKNVGFTKKFYLKYLEKMSKIDTALENSERASVPTASAFVTEAVSPINAEGNSSPQKVTVNEVAKVLSNDPKLCTKWKDLQKPLGLPVAEIVSWERNENTGIKKADIILQEILILWKSQTGRAATVQKLVDILKQCNFITAGESLEDEFPQNLNSKIELN